MNVSATTKFETVIGLEVHLQLDTATKIFCGCANRFGAEPNTNICPVCLGLPGALPVVNKETLVSGVKVGLALNCGINTYIKFDRKNYFYPDCPKAYQITQYDFPINHTGYLTVEDSDGNLTKVRITRAHLEEDAGKLIHDNDRNCSLVDYNRTGTPLLEIVSEPDMHSPQEAYDFLQTLKLNLLYLDVSDCDMEKGSLRCDANISIRPVGETKLGTKTELKNMNSFKAVKTALEYEISRQTKLVRAGEKIIQQTLLWDDDKGITLPMRSKEQAHDYRYFPDPDLPPFSMDEAIIETVRQTIPELPLAKLARLQEEFGLSTYDAHILIQDKHLANFFESCAQQYKDTKKICNWINGALMQEMNTGKTSIQHLNLTPKDFTGLIAAVDDGVISNIVAKDILPQMISSGKNADAIIKDQGLAQVSDEGALEAIVDSLLKEHESIANQIKEGNNKAIGFLVGQAMKQSQGKANPKIIGELIRRRLLDE